MDSAPRIVGAVRVVSPRGVLALALRPRLLLCTLSVLVAVVFPLVLLVDLVLSTVRAVCVPAEPSARDGPRALTDPTIDAICTLIQHVLRWDPRVCGKCPHVPGVGITASFFCRISYLWIPGPGTGERLFSRTQWIPNIAYRLLISLRL